MLDEVGVVSIDVGEATLDIENEGDVGEEGNPGPEDVTADEDDDKGGNPEIVSKLELLLLFPSSISNSGSVLRPTLLARGVICSCLCLDECLEGLNDDDPFPKCVVVVAVFVAAESHPPGPGNLTKTIPT